MASSASLNLADARALLLSPLGPVARAGSNRDAVRVSFEFFPPKTDEAEANLWKAIRRLEPLNPAFVSVTYGAGGSTRERTHRTVQRIIAETSLRPAAHLTCVEASRDEVDEVIAGYKTIGVDHIVALRGDPPGSTGIGPTSPEMPMIASRPTPPTAASPMSVAIARAATQKVLLCLLVAVKASARWRTAWSRAKTSAPRARRLSTRTIVAWTLVKSCTTSA